MKKKSKTKNKRSLHSIKTKIALLCTCCILIAVSVNFVFMFQASKNAITDSTDVMMENTAATYTDNVTQAVQQISESVNMLMGSQVVSNYVSTAGEENASDVEELVTMYMNSHSSYEDISIVDENGKIIFSSNSDLIGKDISKESYFTDMVSSGLSSAGSVYTSETSGETCFKIATPLRTDMWGAEAHNIDGTSSTDGTSNTDGTSYTDGTSNTDGTSSTDGTNNATSNSSANTSNTAGNNESTEDMNTASANTENTDATNTSNVEENKEVNLGTMNGEEIAVTEFTGGIIISVKASVISSNFADAKVGSYNSGQVFILDSEGNIIYHPDDSLIGTKMDVQEINDIIRLIGDREVTDSKIITYTFNNEKKYAAYEVNSKTNWIVIVAANKSEVLNSLNAVATNTLLISIVLILLLCGLAYMFTSTITKSIHKITKLINKTAELDFTEDDTFATLSLSKDETGEISRAIEKMRNVLKTMIAQIGEVSNQITESSSNLNNISLSVNNHASKNSATAEELSASTEETAATTEQIHATIELIGNNSADIMDKVSLGTQLSTGLIKRATALKDSTNQATEKTRKIYEEVKVKTDAAIEQSKAVEKISTLSNTIKGIANQTSLLALNASIEAARAGEAGSGFAVVASEIGALANQSTKTVTNITEIVEEVYHAVENMAKSLEQTLNFLESSVLTDYNNFLKSSEEYNADAGIMNETMGNIHKQIDILNNNVQGISESISEINLMINDTSQGVINVADSNSNIVALTANTQEMAKQNAAYAEALKEIVTKFKLD